MSINKSLIQRWWCYMKIYESAENYLENILILKQRQGFVRSVDLAIEMNFSKPSVSRAVHLLEDNNLITIGPGGGIDLTEEGKARAEDIYERHIFLTKYLISIGVDETVASEDACRMEHVLSPESYEAMKRHAENCSAHNIKVTENGIFMFNQNQIINDTSIHCSECGEPDFIEE